MISMKKILNSLTNWYFSRRALPYWYILALDCTMVLMSGYIGFFYALEGSAFVDNISAITASMIVALVVFAVFFHGLHTYRGIVRYTSIVDLQRIFVANLLSTITVSFIYWFFKGLGYDCLPFLSSVHEEFVVSSLLCGVSTLFIWLIRVTVKVLYESFRSDFSIPVAIYGTLAGGIALANSIAYSKDKRYSLKLFISDSHQTKGGYLMGKKVFSNTPEIIDVLAQHKVRTVLVSPLKREAFVENQAMVDSFTNAGIRIMMLPNEEPWDQNSPINFNHLHDVDIEDLLPREQINVDMDAIGEQLRNKRILITGAAGSIGSEMVRQIVRFHPSLMILVDQAETPMHDIRLMMERDYKYIPCKTIVTSITNKAHMEKIFSRHRPQYVFHAAAYKHVPMMEDNPAIAVQNNIYGTRVIADLAVKYDTIKFVMISTDKAVNPTNVMGCSKRICEIYCQSLNHKLWEETQSTHRRTTQFITTRFGNVLGSNGSVIPIFREQIKKGGPVTVTHPDIIRYFMLIPEACRLVLEAGTMGHGGEIFVFDMGKPVKIVDLAKRMIQLSGAEGVRIQFTGLRDGEKLYEEVLNDAEQTRPTTHPKILVAAVREYDYDTAARNEEELLQLSYSHDDMAIVAKMKEIVPEFKSRVSKYEVLDN